MIKPAYIVLDLSEHLPQLRDAISDSVDEVITENIINEEIDNYIDAVFACIEDEDKAYDNLLNLRSKLYQHVDDQSAPMRRVCSRVGQLGLYVLDEVTNMGGYAVGHQFPYFYSGRNPDDSIILAAITDDLRGAV